MDRQKLEERLNILGMGFATVGCGLISYIFYRDALHFQKIKGDLCGESNQSLL